MQKFKVLRPHVGDKSYAVGDEREADPQEVAGLIGKVLEPIEVIAPKSSARKKKATRPPENKG